MGGSVVGTLHIEPEAEAVEVVLGRRDGVLVDHLGYRLIGVVNCIVNAAWDELAFITQR